MRSLDFIWPFRSAPYIRECPMALLTSFSNILLLISSHLKGWVCSLMANSTWAPSLANVETAPGVHTALWSMEGLQILRSTQYSPRIVAPSKLNHWRHQPMYLVTNSDHHECSKHCHTVKENSGWQMGAFLLENSSVAKCTQGSYMRCSKTTPTLSSMSSTMHKKIMTTKYLQIIKCLSRRNS